MVQTASCQPRRHCSPRHLIETALPIGYLGIIAPTPPESYFNVVILSVEPSIGNHKTARFDELEKTLDWNREVVKHAKRADEGDDVPPLGRLERAKITHLERRSRSFRGRNEARRDIDTKEGGTREPPGEDSLERTSRATEVDELKTLRQRPPNDCQSNRLRT